MGYGISHRHGSTAALIRPLAWELTYAAGVDLKKKKSYNHKNEHRMRRITFEPRRGLGP